MFRRRRDVACETSPIRTHDEVIKRYAKTPIAKTEPKSDPVNGNDANRRLTKLEMNLKRFEDERRIFSMEKDKFEREKQHLEHLRFQRLLEFERKRSMQQSDRQQLAAEAAAIALAEIEKQRVAASLEHHRHRRSKSKSRERSFSGSNIFYGDDYESSTATSSSSRDDDFNDHEFTNEFHLENIPEPPPPLAEPPSFIGTNDNNNNNNINDNNNNSNNQTGAIFDESQTNEAPKQMLLLRLLFGKAKPKKVPEKLPNRETYLNSRVDDGGPISMRRIIFIESPLVWHQVIEMHEQEWADTMRLRNKCIANLVLLIIFFGFGGLIFRFVEGAFENFYKCGVRRVKRDFVDHLWSSSRDLRLFF